jgi:hypothetical protein
MNVLSGNNLRWKGRNVKLFYNLKKYEKQSIDPLIVLSKEP